MIHINKLIKQFPEFAEQFPEIPSLIYKALNNAAQTHQQADIQQREIALLRQQLETNHRSTLWTVILSATLISAAIYFQ